MLQVAMGARRRTGGGRRRLAALAVVAALGSAVLLVLLVRAALASQVSAVSVSISPATAGVSSTYTVNFTATSTLASGSGTVTFNANGGESGTVFPSGASAYVITDNTHSSGSGTVSTAPTLANAGSQVTFTVPKKITAGDALKVVVSGVTNPSLASASQTVAVSTSADTTAVSSPAYALSASPDGSGSLSVSPTTAVNGGPVTLGFTYTATTGGTSSGKVTIAVPTGWTAPTTTSGTAGYTTASSGTVTTSGQTITVSGVSLPAGGTLSVSYGAGGGANAAVAASSVGSFTFTGQEASTASGTLTTLAASPAVTTTYAPDGSGTLTASPASVPNGTTATETFTYTAATGGTANGTVTLAVPTGWTAPTTTSGTAGYTTASSGTVSTSGQTITVSNLTLAANATLTVTYGAGGGANAAVAPASVAGWTFTGTERSTTNGTLSALAASPTVTTTYAPDGSGSLTVSPTSVVAGTPVTETFTYTAASGGTANGTLTLAVPTGWTAPTTTSGTAGYTTASTGTLTISGQTITISSLTLAANATLTVTYGAGGGADAATAATSIGTNTFAAQEASTTGGTLTNLSASPTVTTTPAPDGSGTLTVSPTSVTAYSPTTLTLTYTAAAGGLSGGAVTIATPFSWTGPTTTPNAAGYTTSSTGVLSVSGQAITVTGVTLPAGGTLTVTYGAGGGANSVTDQAMVPSSKFGASEQSTTGGITTALGASPTVAVSQPSVSVSPGAVSTAAGSGGSAHVDGTGTAASFNPMGGTVVVGGYAYQSEAGGIRKIDLATHAVTTLAGSGVAPSGCANGASGSQSGFDGPGPLTTDGYYLYVSDTGYQGYTCQGIRRVSLATGATSMIYNSTSAVGLAFGPDGYLYASNGTYIIYRIDPINGTATTFVTDPGGSSMGFYSLTADGSYLWSASRNGSSIYNPSHLDRISLTDGTITDMSDSDPGLGALVSAGNYLYASSSYAVPGYGTSDTFVRRYSKTDGSWLNVAGTTTPAYVDATGTDAWFAGLTGLASDGTNLWAADAGNNRLREIAAALPLPAAQSPLATTTTNVAPGLISTYAGSGANTHKDGTGTAAGFSTMGGTVVVGRYAYQSEVGGIRKINLSSGQVTTFAGNGSPACVDAPTGGQARFDGPGALTTDGYYLYVSDTGYQGTDCQGIRRVSLATGATSTLYTANNPTGMTFGPDGYLYAVNALNVVLRIDPVNGTATNFVTYPRDGYGTMTSVYSIAADGQALWVGIQTNTCGGEPQCWQPNRIDRVDATTAAVTTLASDNPGVGVLVSAGNYLYATLNNGVNGDTHNYGVTQYNKTTGASTLVAGSGTAGNVDSLGPYARFANITGLASDGTSLWVADSGNNTFRRTIIGATGAQLTAAELAGGGSLCWPCLMKELGLKADPIGPESGDFFHTFDDLAIPGRGLPLDFSRTYNSSSANINSPLGYGWSYSYGQSLTITTQQVTFNQGNGSQTNFVPNGQGGWTPDAPRTLAILTHNGDGTWALVVHNRSTYTFDSSGRLTGEADLNGYTTTISYPNGNTTVVTDPAGRTLTISLTNGLITQVADSASPQRTVQFQYNDGQGNLTDVIDVGGGHWQFTYDPSHRLLTMRSPKYYGDTTTTPAPVVTNHYDTSGWVDWQSDPDGRTTHFDYTGYTRTTFNGTIKVTDPNGDVEAQTYTNGLLTTIVEGYGTPQAATTTIGYDPNLAVPTQITDPNGHATNRYYDPTNGNLLAQVDPLGHTTSYTYDTLNDPTSATDANGLTTTMVYDTAGNLQSSSTPLLDGNGNVLSRRTTVDTHGDAAHPGDVTAVTDPDGKTTTMSYDTFGDLTSVTDPMGDETTYGYNTGTGWRTSMVVPNGNVAGGDPAAHTTSYTYNNHGQLLTATDPLGHVQVNNTYDPDGQLATSTDADLHQTGYSYDPAGQRLTVTRADTSTLGYSYDADGNQTGQTDAAGHTTTYAFNDPAYPHAVTSTTDPDSRTTSYSYDPAGNQVTKQDSGGNCTATPKTGCTTVGYTAANQPAAITYSDGTTPNVTYSYDTLGRRHTMVDGTGTSTYSYDSLGRLTSETNGAGAAIGYGYDLNGQLTAITYPGGTNTVTRGYDDAGRLTSVTDWLGHQTVFGYDADSNLTTQNYPNNTTATYTPDAADRLMAITDAPTNNPNNPFATFTYGRDNANQVSSVSSTGVPTDNHTYTYTTLNQLQGVNAASYGYDSGDNLATLISGATQSFDPANQLCWQSPTGATGTCNTAPAGATTYAYDTRGNRTTQTPAGGTTTTLTYDQANRLTVYGSAATYTYNGDGLRTSKTVSGTTTQQTWEHAQRLPLLLSDGVSSYIYGPGALPLEQVSNTSALYYHHDQLGSTRILTDLNGNVAGTVTYDPQGNVTGSTGAIASIGFNGQYVDAETGLIYLRNRYYDPTTGTFLSRDPLTSLTHSPYGYVNGNTLNRSDPLGLVGGDEFDNEVADGTASDSSDVSGGGWDAANRRLGDAGEGELSTLDIQGDLGAQDSPESSEFQESDCPVEESYHAQKRAYERSIEPSEVVKNADSVYYDNEGNQVYVEKTYGSRNNVAIVDPSTKVAVTVMERSDAAVQARLDSGEWWSLDD